MAIEPWQSLSSDKWPHIGPPARAEGLNPSSGTMQEQVVGFLVSGQVVGFDNNTHYREPSADTRGSPLSGAPLPPGQAPVPIAGHSTLP